MLILAIDPGTTQSGWVLFDGRKVRGSGTSPNAHVLERIRVLGGYVANGLHEPTRLAVERFEARGMPIGDDSIETLLPHEQVVKGKRGDVVTWRVIAATWWTA